jgi:hypothetical protein
MAEIFYYEKVKANIISYAVFRATKRKGIKIEKQGKA